MLLLSLGAVLNLSVLFVGVVHRVKKRVLSIINYFFVRKSNAAFGRILLRSKLASSSPGTRVPVFPIIIRVIDVR
jgi:hypothetical protein